VISSVNVATGPTAGGSAAVLAMLAGALVGAVFVLHVRLAWPLLVDALGAAAAALTTPRTAQPV
jgi:hypothetical protein